MNDQALRLFRETCGVGGEIELEVTHVAREETYHETFSLPFVVVGRHPHADLVLAHAEVGQRHAYLQMIDGSLRCIDLDSKTGITWNDGGRRAGWFSASRSVEMGPFRIRNLTAGAAAEGEMARPDPQEAVPDDHDELPAITLEFVNSPPRPTLWQVKRILTLFGRSPSCKVRLEGSMVSKFHCSLIRTARGLWVADLLGGVTVNGERVRWACLADRDQIGVGRYLIRVHYDYLPRTGSSAALGSLVARGEDGLPPRPTRHAALPQPPAVSRNGSNDGSESAPAGALAAALPTGIELSDPALAPLVGQFAQMQQHMLEQFQQTMLSMVRLFGNLHRDQLALVRQELDRLHELTGELHALRIELSAKPTANPRPPVVDPGLHADEHRATTLDADTASAVEARGSGQPRPALEGRKQSPKQAPRQGGELGSATNDRPEAPPTLPPRPQSVDVHTWLQKRFDAIQRERQTRWQKLLSFLRKKPRESGPTGGALP